MKKQKANGKLDEKSLTVLSCALAVAVMILLLSGDMIITQFIRVNPNQEYPELQEKKEEKPQEEPVNNINNEEKDNNYDVSFLNQTTIEKAIEKINSGDRVIIFSGRSTCPPCQSFVPILKETFEELNITNALYFDRNTIDEKTSGYTEFLKYSDILEEEFDSTPFLMIFQDGKWKDYIIGMAPSKEALKEELKQLLN